MKKIFILSYFLFNILFANECYKSFDYKDTHEVTTTLKKQSQQEEIEIKSTLHFRFVNENNSSYIIAWLKNPNLKKNAKNTIETESIYAPFLIKRRLNNTFLLKSLQIVSTDYYLKEQFIGLIDMLQFKENNETYFVVNANGKVKVEQTSKGKKVLLKHLESFSENIKNPDINYLESDIKITPSHDCFIWKSVYGIEKIEMKEDTLKVKIIDNRALSLTESMDKLDKNHWFFQLTTDIKKWKFGKSKNILSLLEASKVFSAKEAEMKELLNDSKGFEAWVRANGDFLQYLDTLLEGNSLDDEVSQKLFANLGYVDTVLTTNVLSRITLNSQIDEKERFRGVMALQGTSAPIDEDTLSEILDYGLSSDNGEDFIQNSLGMLVGSMAKARLDRAPEQAEEIKDNIINAIKSKENKTVSLAAAGNMLTSAPEDLIQEVDNILLASEDSYTRAKSANALSRIEKSNVSTNQFTELLKNEGNREAQTQLIRASASASNFKSDTTFRTFLVDMADNRQKVAVNRVEALKTLEKANFGKTQEEKRHLRKMMLGEKNSDIAKMLKKLYRQE